MILAGVGSSPTVAAEPVRGSAAPRLIESFEGLGRGFSGPQGRFYGRSPSDTSLAVGPNHIVQVVNTRMAIFTKAGAVYGETGRPLYGPVETRNVFRGFGGPCETINNGDAVVRYDQLADRWLIVMPIFTRLPKRSHEPSAPAAGEPPALSMPGRSDQPGPAEPLFQPAAARLDAPQGGHAPERPKALGEGSYAMCYAVSATPDPLGAYYRYEFVRPLFPDYPRPAIWPDGYYVPTSTGDTVIQKHACVAERAKMLAGKPARELCIIVDGVNFLNNADLDGTALPPKGAPNIVIAAGGSQLKGQPGDDALYVWKYHVDWDHPTRSRLVGPTRIAVEPYRYLCGGQLTKCVPQPRVDMKIDAQGDKIMQRFTYRRIGDQQSLLAAHSIEAGGSGGVRWYELRLDARGDPRVYQQGTYAPDPSYHWMPSIAMDRFGSIGVGYSFADAQTYVGQRFAGRVAADPVGQMAGETVLVHGQAAQADTLRWEDYVETAVDPSDDCTFWYTGDYLGFGDAAYSTRIGAFRVGTCGAAAASKP
ncbi:hypothetical protein [Sphingomonas nostoxanthinifaciens]|uniref:hypothetical protein n=1 Tax=Sphingomonas nostoxanthinifaciens TaxID=2872652 RepID=UPI001CC21D5B|nr:hypothetical protein [Sphingomonas nostoxanthinifaciens]UAK23135.1 hypothetical protein K8P63_11985 [Sphingomonas nostoxanthinifaciens]